MRMVKKSLFLVHSFSCEHSFSWPEDVKLKCMLYVPRNKKTKSNQVPWRHHSQPCTVKQPQQKDCICHTVGVSAVWSGEPGNGLCSYSVLQWSGLEAYCLAPAGQTTQATMHSHITLILEHIYRKRRKPERHHNFTSEHIWLSLAGATAVHYWKSKRKLTSKAHSCLSRFDRPGCC